MFGDGEHQQGDGVLRAEVLKQRRKSPTAVCNTKRGGVCKMLTTGHFLSFCVVLVEEQNEATQL